jgi:hypothetical protein
MRALTQVAAVVVAGAVLAPQVRADVLELLAPPNGTALVMKRGVPVTFTWRTAAGESGYRFQLSRDASFKDPVADRQIAQSSTVVRELEPGRYYWRCATDIAGWSPTHSFTLRLAEPSAGR